MTPEYIKLLADSVDAGALWRLSITERKGLTLEQHAQLDIGVALRRHANHVRTWQALVGTGKSLLITPLSMNGVMINVILTPPAQLTMMAARIEGDDHAQDQ
jgi:hypothetical protein